MCEKEIIKRGRRLGVSSSSTVISGGETSSQHQTTFLSAMFFANNGLPETSGYNKD